MAGIKFTEGVGGRVGGGESGAGRSGLGTELPTGNSIRMSSWASDGVVREACAEDDPRSKSASSSSIGSSERVDGEIGRRPGDSRAVSGTRQSLSSIWIHLRNDSRAPANRPTLFSMLSIRWLVRAVSSATLSMTFTRSLRTASRLSCSLSTA